MDLPKILLDFIANPATWAVVLILIWLLWLSKTKKAAIIRDAALHAFHIVEGLELSGNLPEGLSKEAAALKKFRELLENQNYKVTDAAVDLAKLLWASFAAQHKEVVATRAAATAITAAAGVTPVPPR
jgi:hypothetical protein